MGSSAAAIAMADQAASDRRRQFEAAIRQDGRRLLGLAYSILRDHGDAEDAVQETMVLAWRAWDTIKDADRRGPWLTRICVNHCLRRRRQLHRVLAAVIGQDIETSPVGSESDLAMDEACKRLTRQQRAVVTLHYRYGYSLDECAHLMNRRPGTVRSHLARALTTLRRELSDG
jgi:RNA polymerase sigma-70 factor (ECF subfamily)